jgi:adenylate cyclase
MMVRLRPTLVTMIVGLVLLTSLGIGGSVGILTVASTRSLIDQTRAAAVAAASEHAHDFFETAPQNTHELAAEARRGILPLDQPERLVALFMERMQDRPQLAWIGYGERAGGRYFGATRYARGEIVGYIADPQVAGGIPRQIASIPAESLSHPRLFETKPFLVATRGWFQRGLATAGTSWTDFYQFAGGGLGISCMTRFTAPGAAEPAGVFHADLRLGPISEFLSSLHVGRRGAVFLTDPARHRIVSPGGSAAAGKALDKAAERGAAVANGAPIQVASGGRDYEVVFAPVAVDGKLGFDIAVVVDRGDITEGLVREEVVAGIAGLCAILLAIAIGVLLAARIARPVVGIAGDLATVGTFQISRAPAPRSFVREISELGDAVDRMKASLRSFGRYVPTDLVRTLLAAGNEASLGGEIRPISIFFSDIANFTAISERMEPHPLVAAMGRYFETVTEAISRHGGTVDKFIGDGVMAFFNAPTELPDHARRACLAALGAREALALIAQERRPGEPLFRTRIGLALGDVLVGNIGTPDRFAYTIIGDEVNLASRLEGLNDVYGTEVVASDRLAAEAGDGFEWRRLDRVAVKGRRQGTLVCELLGERGRVDAALIAARDLYERALEAYFAADFAAAAGCAAAADRRPGDIAARMMAEHARNLAAAPPENWDGIRVMNEK